MGYVVRRLLVPVLARVGSRTIMTVGGALFLLNMVIPDPIPLLDEFLMLAATILLSRMAQTGETAATGARGPAAPKQGAGAAAKAGAREPKHVGRGSTRS